MTARFAIVSMGTALILGMAALTNAAPAASPASEVIEQDPSPREIRDRVIQILTQVQERNTFQKNVAHLSESLYTPRDSSGRTNTSSVYYELPGKRRKNYDWGDRVAVHMDDKRTLFAGKQSTGTSARIEPVTATLLDVTAIEPNEWITRARSLGINPDKLSEQEWNGKVHYVIGGDPGQLNVPQIWIEKETFLPARAVMFQVRGSNRIFDFRLIGYHTFEDGSVFPTGVEMYEGNYRVSRDQWSRFEINRDPNPDFFDPAKVEEELKNGGPAIGVADGGNGGG